VEERSDQGDDMQEVDSTVMRARRNTIGDAVRRSAGRNPEKDAVVFGGRRWSYAEFDAGVNRVANALLARGLEKGDRVAAYGMNSDAYVLLWLGCSRAGVIHVPVNFHLAGDELLYILNQSGSKALFYDPGLEANVDRVQDRVETEFHGTLQDGNGLDVIGLARGEGDASEPEVDVGEEDVAQILYTSGTTSAPKGAVLTHSALMAEYVSCIEALEFRHDDRALHSLPLYHSAQMHVCIMPYLLIGATNFVLVKPDPGECCHLIESERINSMFAPPTVWISFLRHSAFEEHDLASLEKVQYGASIMPVPVLRELRDRLPDPRFYNCYGQSEISPLATVLRPDELTEERLASVGRPCLFVETRVVDPEMNDVPPGERGEIVHRSPHLMTGYWEKPEETEEAFEGGWFHSGDLGLFDEEGYLYVVDRVKDVINTGGMQVSGSEVEDALFDHEAVSEVAVIGLPDEKWIEAVSAVVVLKDDAEAEHLREELEEHVRDKLADFKRPKHIFFVEDLPRNAAGKILKRELRSTFAAEGEE
jgi:fatty-acyl-CoA synthase